MKKTMLRFLLGAAAAATVFSGTAHAQQSLEVIHWMNGEANAQKLRIVADILKEQGIDWLDNSIPDPEAARTVFVSRVLSGDSPAVGMYNSGGPLTELASQGLLRNLDDIAKEMDWESLVSPAFWDAMNYDGHVYSIPFNVQALNWLWYNVEVLETAGIEPPETWDDVLDAHKKLVAQGNKGLVWSKENWPIIHLFGSSIANVAGPDVYREIYRNHSIDAVRSAEMLSAAETFVAIRDNSDASAAGRSWQDSANLVISGEAAMQHMGDWYKGSIIAAGLTPGVEIGCIVGPGMGMYFADGSSFVLPVTDDPEVIRAQDAFARAVMSKDVQLAIAQVDGATPARLDVDSSTLDLCAQEGIVAMLNPETSVPGDTWMADGFDFDGALFDVSAEMWGDSSLGAQDMVDLMVRVMERFPK